MHHVPQFVHKTKIMREWPKKMGYNLSKDLEGTMKPTGSYEVAQHNGTYFLKLSGHLTYTQCGPFSSFLDRICEEDNYEGVLVDLRERLLERGGLHERLEARDILLELRVVVLLLLPQPRQEAIRILLLPLHKLLLLLRRQRGQLRCKVNLH